MKKNQSHGKQGDNAIIRKTLLIVEDEPLLRKMYQTKLEKEGFQVYAADDGDPGLEMAQKYHPDLILLDIILNSSDGFSVLDHLKKNEKTSSIPVIMVSNLSSSDDRQHALDLGADDFYIKARITPAELAEKVKKKLKLPV